MMNVQCALRSAGRDTRAGFGKIAILLLLILTSSVGLYAQALKVTGVVKDKQQQPLPGVTVRVENGSATTVTNTEGEFTITVPGKSAVLLFSYIGFEPVKVTVGDRQQINVTMKDQSSDLNEVVVQGYGTVKKKDLTGAVGLAPMSDINKAPVLSIGESLEGRIAGVQISTSDGQPGSPINIVVRGANSITQDNNPLYVVDGFPIEGFNLSLLSPQDIESIDVLKDASSTAIYGARGANGVVMITTKKGKEGKPVINAAVTQSYSSNTKRIATMDSYDFLQEQLQLNPAAGAANNPYTPTYQYFTTPGKTLQDYVNAPTADWQSPFFKTGSLRTYYVALRGGNKQTLYNVTGSVDQLDGIVVNTGSKRYQGRITLDQTVTDKLKVGIDANYSYFMQYGNGLGNPSGNSGTQNIMYSVWGANPITPVSTTQALDPTTAAANDYKFNPLLNQNNIVNNVNTGNLNVNAYLSYNIIPNLTLRVTGNINNTEINTQKFYNSSTQSGSPSNVFNHGANPNGSISTAKNNNWANENTLTWNKSYGKHNLNVLAGFSEYGNTSNTFGFGATYVPNEQLGVSDLDEGTVNPVTTATSSLWTATSWMGRINYNYNSLYYLTFSYRGDGSSKFSEKNHWGYFPSGAAAWRFTQEDFLKGNPVLTDGKLRVSYGKTGNNRVSDFAPLSRFSQPITPGYSFNNQYTQIIVPTVIGNPDLQWETTTQYDAGLDLTFFGGRISFTPDVYRKITSNLLLNASLPTSSGFSSATENIGSVQNQGLELTLSTINIRNHNFSWTSSFNIAFNQSKVLALANNQDSYLTTVPWDNGWANTPAYIAKVGQPLGQMYGWVWQGNYQYSDFNKTATGTYVLKDNVPSISSNRTTNQPGDIRYKDINGDGVIDAKDYTVIGRSLPIHQGGFTNNFTYKNFDLNVFFNWSYGNDIMDANRLMFDTGAGSFRNQFADYNNRWSPTNQNGLYNRVGGYYGGGYSSLDVEDGSYLRLKTVQLGYNLPKNWLQRLKVSSVRIYASGQNLWVWTKYSGEDPEVSTYSSVLSGGFDYSAYPRARTFAFGINANF